MSGFRDRRWGWVGGAVALALGSWGCGGDSGSSGSGGSSGGSSAGTSATTAGTTVGNTAGTTASSTASGTTTSSSTTATGPTSGASTATSGGTGSGSSGGPSGGIQTVFIILFENHDWSTIKGSSSAPYINSLLADAAWAENYHNVPNPSLHPSEPNYIWLEAGDSLGFTDDSDPGPSNCAVGEDHLTKQLEGAGVSWKSYQEDFQGGNCPLSGVGDYAPKHNPMIFFDDVSGTDCNDTSAPDCLAHVVPYTDLSGDLDSGSVARYNFLTPNTCNDMHTDCGTGDQIKQGDDWLSAQIPMIQASDAYKNGGAIFITWDEGGSGNQPIGMIVLSPLAKPGYSNTVAYTHSSTLRTMQTVFGVSPFLHDAANATDLGDLFTQFP